MIEIAGGEGAAIRLRQGEALHLVNTSGQQVVDFWALAAADPQEVLSVEHTRRMLSKLSPRAGDTLFSNRRSPMLLLEEDSAPGRHDMLVACCDAWLYRHYGCPPGHRNCRDNYIEALAGLGIAANHAPNPVNLWMNVPVAPDGGMTLAPPVSRPGDHVVMRALMDVVLVCSACPMDITPVNGADRRPRPVHYRILPA